MEKRGNDMSKTYLSVQGISYVGTNMRGRLTALDS